MEQITWIAVIKWSASCPVLYSDANKSFTLVCILVFYVFFLFFRKWMKTDSLGMPNSLIFEHLEQIENYSL